MKVSILENGALFVVTRKNLPGGFCRGFLLHSVKEKLDSYSDCVMITPSLVVAKGSEIPLHKASQIIGHGVIDNSDLTPELIKYVQMPSTGKVPISMLLDSEKVALSAIQHIGKA